MSTLRVNTLQNASGVEVYTAKAWVNFNGTGTVAIRAAGNVSSITDNGVADYTVNFINAMPDTNYCFNVTSSWFSGASGSAAGGVKLASASTYTTKTASAVRFETGQGVDPVDSNVAIFR